MVERPGGGGVRVDAASVERRELAFGPTSEVRHHDVTVQMRIKRTADPVHESGRGHGVGGHGDEPRRHGPAGRRGPGVPHSRARRPRPARGRRARSSPPRRAQGVEHAHRLGRAEAQVEGGHRDPVVGASQPVPGDRVVASQHRCERLAVDLSVQIESGGASAEPQAGRLDAGAGAAARPPRGSRRARPCAPWPPAAPDLRARPRPVRDWLPVSMVTGWPCWQPRPDLATALWRLRPTLAPRSGPPP